MAKARRPSGLTDLPAYDGAIAVARFYLDRAEQAIRRLEKKGDDEALHDFRVSLRRLRSNLQAYEPYLATAVSAKQRRKIRNLASATGTGRDAEVHLAWLDRQSDAIAPAEEAGYQRLRDELKARLDAGYGKATTSAPKRFRKVDARLRRRLDRLDTAAKAGGLPDGVRFASAVERVLPEYAGELDTHLSRVHSPADSTEGHRARIRAKRLRYLLEPIAEDVAGADALVQRLRELQDVLGDLHDVQLLAAYVAELERSATREPDASETGPGLRRIAARLATDQDDLFDELRKSWLGDASERFFMDVEALRRALGARARTDVEIERKYLLTGLPESLNGRTYREIDQGYLPGARLQERVRRVRDGDAEWYVRTVKVGSGIRRIELQEEADRPLFDALWPLTEGRRVIKHRYRIPEDGLVWEVDDFTDRDLVLAEVELPSEDVEPKLPEWLAPYVVREVTDEAAYVNVNLAR